MHRPSASSYNHKHWDSAYLRQGTSYQCRRVANQYESVNHFPYLPSFNSDESGKQSLYPESDPYRHQNLLTCSLAHCQPSPKMSCKSIRNFSCAKLLTDRQTHTHNNNDYISSLAEVKKT